jgi:pyrimidine nucleoside transport protein
MSEINAVMTSGFATIAGTVMAAYISFGVSPAHLLSASVMSAPAALASAKLLLPETQASKVRKATDIELSNVTTTTNLLDAATEGASTAAFLVLNITAIVVAFIAFVAFLNSLVAFFAGLVGFPDLTFEVLLGYVFVPVAFVMGVDWSECQTVGTLIGIKTVANEFIAYRRLGLLIAEGQLSPRAAIIATYALCGYANPGSIGVQIATLSALCPERKADFTATVGRAFLAGTIACFLTACIAGALLAPE